APSVARRQRDQLAKPPGGRWCERHRRVARWELDAGRGLASGAGGAGRGRLSRQVARRLGVALAAAELELAARALPRSVPPLHRRRAAPTAFGFHAPDRRRRGGRPRMGFAAAASSRRALELTYLVHRSTPSRGGGSGPCDVPGTRVTPADGPLRAPFETASRYVR